MRSRLTLAVACGVLGLLCSSVLAGTSEIEIRESDIVFSRTQPLEVVVRISGEQIVGRVDLARLELFLDVDGEAETFAPFLLVVEAVEPQGEGFHESWEESAREIVVQPGDNMTIRMDATRLVRRWVSAGGELYVRIQAVEPIATERPGESIRLAAANGMLGRIRLATR